MNNKLPVDEVVAQLNTWLEKNGGTPAQRAALMRRLFDGLAAAQLAGAEGAVQLTAPNAVVELVDAASGRLYRRYLELEFEETDNGIRLGGEDMAGRPVQLVYLSEAALRKLHELRGGGPDKPRCEDG